MDESKVSNMSFDELISLVGETISLDRPGTVKMFMSQGTREICYRTIRSFGIPAPKEILDKWVGWKKKMLKELNPQSKG